MAAHAEIKAPQLVASERVCATLQNDGGRAEPVHNVLNHRTEYRGKRIGINSITKRHVDGVGFAFFHAHISHITGPGEKVTKLVERARHHPIRRIKRLFHTISVMHVNVNIQNTRIRAQQLKNGQDNVVGIAKTTGFALLRMMQTTRPVDDHIRRAFTKLVRAGNRATT